MTWALHTGDCLDEHTGLATLADMSIDHCITDPPYSAHTHNKQWIGAALTSQGQPRVKMAHASLGFECLQPEQAFALAREVARVSRRWCLVFTDIEGIALWREAVVAAGLDYVRTCVWDKVDGAPQFTGDRPAAGAEAFVVAHRPGRKRWNGGGRRNVFRHAVNGEKGDKPHPSTKPLALMRELVELFTDPGETIVDPFAGSGSTGVAANMLGRHFVGWELDQGYAEIARRRLRGDEAKPDVRQPSLFDAKPAWVPNPCPRCGATSACADWCYALQIEASNARGGEP